MPMPHQDFVRNAKSRLDGKLDQERISEIRQLISELPGYYTGPYGQVRKWLQKELKKAQTKKKTTHRDWFAVKKEGEVQIALVGAPNIGKSSLLKKLTSVQVKVADYAFTTLKPIPAITDLFGAKIQLIEVPGLIEGAIEGKGKGKALLSIAKQADHIILIHDLSKPVQELNHVLKQLQEYGIKSPSLIIANKLDLPGSEQTLKNILHQFKEFPIVAISVTQNMGINKIKPAIWKFLDLIRVYSKDQNNQIAKDPVIFKHHATVSDFINVIHKDLLESFDYAKVWGPSAKFQGQKVGFNHQLQDQDIVQIVSKH